MCAGGSGFGAYGRVPDCNSLRNKSPGAGATAVAVLRLSLSAGRPSILLLPRGAEHTCSWAGPSGAFQLQQHKTDMSQAQEISRAAHGTHLWCLLLSLHLGLGAAVVGPLLSGTCSNSPEARAEGAR